jgi:AcrR family transcriptional regulator
MGVQERREREKQGIREEILEAARKLFVTEGYENVSIRKIAERIEYSPGTIYLYFQDKADILAQVNEETFSRLERKLAAINHDTEKRVMGAPARPGWALQTVALSRIRSNLL